jgi:hypothetical protein
MVDPYSALSPCISYMCGTKLLRITISDEILSKQEKEPRKRIYMFLNVT